MYYAVGTMIIVYDYNRKKKKKTELFTVRRVLFTVRQVLFTVRHLR